MSQSRSLWSILRWARRVVWAWALLGRKALAPRVGLVGLVGLVGFAGLAGCLGASHAAEAPIALPGASGAPALLAAFGPLLGDRALTGARLTLLVTPANGGAPVFGYHPDERLHPASNTKLLTTAAALVRLGPGYTFATDLAAPPLIRGVASALHLIGRGDPSFLSESLWKLIEEARLNGLKEVAGDLIVDETFFTAAHSPPGFESKTTDEAFRAPSGAASLNFNQLVVSVWPGEKAGTAVVVRVSPDSGYATVINTGRTRAKGKPRLNVIVVPDRGRVTVRVSGSLTLDGGPFVTRRRIDDPGLFLGMTARMMLSQAGIPVRGKIRSGRAPVDTILLARSESRPLGALIGDVNKFSNNFMAEQLVRTLGAVRRGRGDWSAGCAEVLDFVHTELGRDGLRFANGSGLFGDTAFSARDVIRLLTYMKTRQPYLPEFEASLAVGGIDGTMARRARGFAPYTLRVKTGTLDGVVALSGYAPFADGTTAAFSILMNDVPGRAWEVWKLHDRMLELIGRFDPASGTLRAPPAEVPVAP